MGKGVAVEQNIAYPIILRKPTNTHCAFRAGVELQEESLGQYEFSIFILPFYP